MESLNREHRRNIERIFEARTGVALRPRAIRRPVRLAVVLAAALVCLLTATAFSAGLFSSLAGDELSLSAAYEGDGLVTIQVENRSDKVLRIQPRLRLMRWSTAEEVEPLSSDLSFTGTEFGPHESGTMTIDLSRAYDVAALEEPLTDDHYYFVLTNNNFLFGQDWMCTVFFAEPVQDPAEESDSAALSEADQALVARIEETLRPYFEGDDPGAIQQEYLAACQELLSQLDGQVVYPARPCLSINGDIPGVIYDPEVPEELQHSLIMEQWPKVDSYGFPVGAREEDRVISLDVILPQREDDLETAEGTNLSLLYFVMYDINDIESPQDYAFIHGQLLTFGELEEYKVYEDGQYVCYDVTDLFYTDLRSYVENKVSRRGDIYFDERVWQRIKNIYDAFRDQKVLAEQICYTDLDSLMVRPSA